VEPIKTFMVEGAELIYMNFSGRELPYNKPGDRNFCVILESDAADLMAKDGWAVKFPEPGEDEKRPFIKVRVGYKIRPPKIVLITSRSRTNLTQDTVGILDWADFINVDLIAQSSNWTHGSRSGISAYLKTMFVTIQEDVLELKYSTDEPEE